MSPLVVDGGAIHVEGTALRTLEVTLAGGARLTVGDNGPDIVGLPFSSFDVTGNAALTSVVVRGEGSLFIGSNPGVTVDVSSAVLDELDIDGAETAPPIITVAQVLSRVTIRNVLTPPASLQVLAAGPILAEAIEITLPATDINFAEPLDVGQLSVDGPAGVVTVAGPALSIHGDGRVFITAARFAAPGVSTIQINGSGQNPFNVVAANVNSFDLSSWSTLFLQMPCVGFFFEALVQVNPSAAGTGPDPTPAVVWPGCDPSMVQPFRH